MKFEVGQQVDGASTEFFVHEEAIARLSKPLNTLLRGDMQESHEGCVKWEEVSKETFERFVQFAYTGDYAAPQAVQREGGTTETNRKSDQISPRDFPEPQEVPPDTTFLVEEDLEMWGSGVSKKKPNKGKNSSFFGAQEAKPVDTFRRLTFPLPGSHKDLEKTCEPAAFDSDMSYSSVFLGHAAIYVLGDFNLIDSLKAIALHRLHKTLCYFILNEDNAADVINLARYAYSEEGSEGMPGEQMGQLRKLVCNYMATNGVELSRIPKFMDYMAEGGQVVKDFVMLAVGMK